MNELAVIVFWVLLGLVAGQAAMVGCFVFALLRWNRAGDAEPFCPKTAVVLCLRGADPFLETCVRALLSQDYEHYDVKVVVDRREDPAWQVVERIVAECQATNVEIRPLTQRRTTCSLKCSSLLQAIGGLDESYEVVALLDADTVPHRTWLRELVAPLADERVGVATGNRWYMPAEVSWGSLVRYLWNTAAVVQMFWYRIPWGGTLALKTKVFRQFDLLDRWGNAFCEDTMLYEVMRNLGLRVAFVPSLMMVNREGDDIPGFFRWVRRQLLTARLYHPRWALVLGHGIMTSTAMAFSAGLLALTLCTGHWAAAQWTAGGLALYMAAMPLLLSPMEWCVRRIVRARGEPTRWLSPARAMWLCAGILVTQVVYATALVSTLLVRNVEWRGVSYRVDGPWKIRVTKDCPYAPAGVQGDTLASL